MRGDRGYSVVQLTDMVVDFNRLKDDDGLNLTANPLKMIDAGRIYRINGTFEEVLDQLKRSYRFVGLEEGQSRFDWLMKMQEEVQKQREGKITDEFVDHINRTYFARFGYGYKATKQDMIKHFSRFSL